MNKTNIIKLNQFIFGAYKCTAFTELLKYVIINLHGLVMYESGMFFCGISQDCSFFKPYLGVLNQKDTEAYYYKQDFPIKEEYLKLSESRSKEALVYKASEYQEGIVEILNEPRNNFLSSQRDYHIVCIRIVNNDQFLGEIYLHRSKEKPDFDEEDLFTLNLMQPHISNVFGQIHMNTAIRFLETNEQFRSQKGICIFDKEMNLSGGNVAGLDMLKWATAFNSSILYHVKETCLDILSNEQPLPNHDARCFNHSIKVGKGVLNYTIYFEHSLSKDKPEFIVIMEFLSNEQIVDDYKLKFTKREADVIDGLLQGKTNIQISQQLNISENTVRSHVKNVYLKTGVNNRTELTYIMMKS